VAYNGTSVTTPEINTSTAVVKLQLSVDGLGPAKNAFANTVIYNQQGKVVAQVKKSVADNIAGAFHQQFLVSNPIRWSVEKPYLYKAVTQLYSNGKLVDDYTTTFGIRSFTFDADKGFYLNGVPLKIRGVCNHHDLGCLGTAVNYRATERQLEILKAMGCNAIRTSHNPPSPELLTLCDKMGFLVMDEAFDMWEQPKNPFDYHADFKEWSKRDLQDQVKRDRNHPSVIIWSLGNEIYEQWAKEGDNRPYEILKTLYQSVRELDTTRPTVTANNFTDSWNRLIKADITEIIGYNYHHEEWNDIFKKWKKKPFIITESVSALQTRGHYDMPSDSIRRWPERWDLPLTTGNVDTTCSAYENCATPWGSTHEETLKIFEKSAHISGMFIWTGFDYMGEPTPYPWPARSSYFGIVDMAGFPKDCYYLYQSLWTNKTVLHVFPHWNWQPGQTIDLWAYYNNADEAELFINDKSQGLKRKTNEDLHVMWRVKYEPGSIKVITKRNGKTVATKTINTAGEPSKIILSADRSSIISNGTDLSFVTAKVVDKKGNLVPAANHLISFEVTNNGFIAGTDNGLQTDLTPLTKPYRKAWKGLCLAVVGAAGTKQGIITVKATAPGLQSAAISITIK
jgi:beta-galactosidase